MNEFLTLENLPIWLEAWVYWSILYTTYRLARAVVCSFDGCSQRVVKDE